MGQVGRGVKVFLVPEQPFEGFAVPLEQTHLAFVLVMGIFGQQIAVLDFIAEVRVDGCNLVLRQKIADSQQ